MVVQLNFIGLKEVNDRLKRLSKEIPEIAKESAGEVADEIISVMRDYVPEWRGNLYMSLAKKVQNEEVDIYGLFYWRFVENGIILHTISPTLVQWAQSKWGSNYLIGLKGLIKKGYTEPHEFVRPAVNQVLAEIDSIIQTKLDELK